MENRRDWLPTVLNTRSQWYLPGKWEKHPSLFPVIWSLAAWSDCQGYDVATTFLIFLLQRSNDMFGANKAVFRLLDGWIEPNTKGAVSLVLTQTPHIDIPWQKPRCISQTGCQQKAWRDIRGRPDRGYVPSATLPGRELPLLLSPRPGELLQEWHQPL